ncbi:TetR/AcrR family transcriptional regulator [Actinomadura logoneensis]|uniref:TetR/AcrR family transcriptional regulator n=1 Tax=Actinomadura logoneensis TaxID=2293572 RepID=A0A372JBH3_9ACTN|nr:TetR/AcrR family transcriptional regulator [Actinomadura logoneensis]RFU37343.1 TetR/AcrR family transcriptional regulator [Actinomadura logoneensis]
MVETPPGDKSRDQVLETAARLFSDLGYDTVDLKLIADATGLTTSGLTELVGDKPTLYLAVFTWLHQVQQESMAEALETFTPDAAGLQGIGDAFLDFCLRHRAFVGMWMHRWAGDAADLDVETPFAKPVLAAMNEVMAPAVQPGVDLELTIWSIIWCVHGFVQFGFIGQDGESHGSDTPAAVARFRAHLHNMINRFVRVPA